MQLQPVAWNNTGAQLISESKLEFHQLGPNGSTRVVLCMRLRKYAPRYVDTLWDGDALIPHKECREMFCGRVHYYCGLQCRLVARVEGCSMGKLRASIGIRNVLASLCRCRSYLLFVFY